MEQSKLDRNAKKFEIIKNCTETIALLIGGIWALFNFRERDLPMLETAVSITPGVNMKKIQDLEHGLDCKLTFGITITNNSAQSTFYVDSVVVCVYQIPYDSMINQRHFNRKNINLMTAPVISDVSHNNGLITVYPPKYSSGEIYYFSLKNDSAVTTDITYTVYGRDDKFIAHKFVKSSDYLLGRTYTN